MLQLAETVYAFLEGNLFQSILGLFPVFYDFDVTYEEWEPGDLSETRVSVDGGCVQLLVDLLERPGCPLEDTPEETLEQQESCRLQLARDVALGLSYIPVTSYLAYTQRVNINICLLSWMVISSKTICRDVPHRVLESVSEARRFFSDSEGESCRQNGTTDTVCSVSRAVFSFKCDGFYKKHEQRYCNYVYESIKTDPRVVLNYGKDGTRVSERVVTLRKALYDATIKYRTFKIDHLQSLEISLISINIFFRCLTASVFLYLAKLRNLPGKLLLCYQMTALAQVLFSEVVYRMSGVPDLATTVQVDSALTLLTCAWLNAFCHQLFSGVRHLRLPDALDPREASRLLRSYVARALAAWTVVTSVFVCLERVSERYLLHSRALLLAAISASVLCNFLLLLVVAFTFIRTRQTMSKLSVTTGDKFGSKKQLLFMSVKTFLLSGLGILVRVGFHQADGVAWIVYYVHLTSMLQGPVIFVLFVCNGTALPQLRQRLQRWWNPDVAVPEEDLCSTARCNLGTRRLKMEHNVAETAM